MVKRWRRRRAGNMRKEPCRKPLVVSSQKAVRSSMSLQSMQKPSELVSRPAGSVSALLPARGSSSASGQCSHRKPPRIRLAQLELPLQTPVGHWLYFRWRMSISHWSPAMAEVIRLMVKEILKKWVGYEINLQNFSCIIEILVCNIPFNFRG